MQPCKNPWWMPGRTHACKLQQSRAHVPPSPTPQYISDLIAGMVTVMEGPHTGPFNVGNPGEFTMLELANLVREVVNPNAVIEYRENTADDPSKRKWVYTRARVCGCVRVSVCMCVCVVDPNTVVTAHHKHTYMHTHLCEPPTTNTHAHTHTCGHTHI